MRNSSNLSGLGLVSRCQLGGQECHNQTSSMYAIGVLERSHRWHFTRAIGTRGHCLENARIKWSVNFKHNKAHQGQWQDELADSLPKMGSYSFPSESTLPLLMARWYQKSQTPAQTIPVTDSNPTSVPFWLQVARLPVPHNVVMKHHSRANQNNDGETGGEIKRQMESGHCQMCSPSSLPLKKEAAGIFASGRRLEFEECIANLEC